MQIYVRPIISFLYLFSFIVRFTIASKPSALWRLSQEYGRSFAQVACMIRIFFDSLRLSAPAVLMIGPSFTQNERGVYLRRGSKNCQLIIENGFMSISERTSDIVFFSKSGSHEA